MERLSDAAISIVDDLHTECLNYYTGYIPLINALDKLADFEDAEENGTLIKLPCKVGETVYFPDGDKGIVTSFYHYADPQQGNAWISILNKQGYRNNTKRVQVNYGDFGKTVFFTREEAEAELKRRETNG